MRVHGHIRRLLSFSALVALGTVGGCHRHTASVADCRAILDRLVALELAEQGFRDPALLPRWQEELARRFDDDLRSCRAVRVGDDLEACLRDARNPEEIAHHCVR